MRRRRDAWALAGIFALASCQRRGDRAPGPEAIVPAPVPAPVPVLAPVVPQAAVVAAPLPTPPAPAAPQHLAAYQHPLLFHYAHIGGRATGDREGMLHHDDGQYFELGPGDSLTLEAPEGQQFLSDGNPQTGDVEVVLHPHAGETRVYEVDVSFDHLDADGPWTMLTREGGHEVDLDHAGIVAARYVRIRNNDPACSVYLDAVYARTMQPCTNPRRCPRVTHGVARGRR